MTDATDRKTVTYYTGSEAHWAPPGFTVRIDTSWDRRGYHVAARKADVLKSWRGSPSDLGGICVREGTPVLIGRQVWLLAGPDVRGNGGLGYSDQPRMSPEDAERIFAEHATPAT